MVKRSCHGHETNEHYGLLIHLIDIRKVQCTTRCQKLQVIWESHRLKWSSFRDRRDIHRLGEDSLPSLPSA